MEHSVTNSPSIQQTWQRVCFYRFLLSAIAKTKSALWERRVVRETTPAVICKFIRSFQQLLLLPPLLPPILLLLLSSSASVSFPSSLVSPHCHLYYLHHNHICRYYGIFYYCRVPSQQTEQELQRQRSVEVAQLYRQRRHISQDDTLSLNSSTSETDLSQQQQEERRVRDVMSRFIQSLEFFAKTRILAEMKIENHGKIYFT